MQNECCGGRSNRERDEADCDGAYSLPVVFFGLVREVRVDVDVEWTHSHWRGGWYGAGRGGRDGDKMEKKERHAGAGLGAWSERTGLYVLDLLDGSSDSEPNR